MGIGERETGRGRGGAKVDGVNRSMKTSGGGGGGGGERMSRASLYRSRRWKDMSLAPRSR